MTQLIVVLITLKLWNLQLYTDYRMQFTWAKGSGFALGATSETTKTFQILSVPSPAADATVQPFGLWNKYMMKKIRLWTRKKIMARRISKKIKTLSIRQVQGSKQLGLVHPVGLK
jgi:hypothetical protein